MPELCAPFPWFGGKRRVAHIVWRAFGADIANYIEPFAGSLAVLLGRPGGAGKVETVNDRDCFLSNFWRAVTADPEAVAAWCDWPVNEADLHARHAWLVSELETHRARMHSDADYYDEKIAGWWIWGLCQWIGSGWCVEPNNHKLSQQIPNLYSVGNGVHSLSQQIPLLRVTAGASGSGVHSKRGMPKPHWQKRPDLHAVGKGVPAPCLEWFSVLSERLRRVRVACGDWRRVLSPSVLGTGKNVGGRAVFLDPPYSHEFRDPRLYAEDDASVSDQVREWALEHGDDPDLRIALCGYEGEHEMPPGWTVHAWKAAGGYAVDNDNRERERIWFSPHCLPVEEAQRLLFPEAPL